MDRLRTTEYRGKGKLIAQEIRIDRGLHRLPEQRVAIARRIAGLW